jgi:hypothetical protein
MFQILLRCHLKLLCHQCSTLTPPRGIEPMLLQEGFIPTSPISFEWALSKLILSMAVATPPPKHRRKAPVLPSLPR